MHIKFYEYLKKLKFSNFIKIENNLFRGYTKWGKRCSQNGENVGGNVLIKYNQRIDSIFKIETRLRLKVYYKKNYGEKLFF